MPGFLTERFPDHISFGSSGGPSYRTTVTQVLSGHEQRNSEWEFPLHIYNVSYGARRTESMKELLNFYQAARGRAYGFRYKDWLDYSAHSHDNFDPVTLEYPELVGNEQTILGPGPVYQLQKQYVVGADYITRVITRPVPGTLKVMRGGSPVTPTNVDYEQGTFEAGGSGLLTAGFEFDVPCRFESDNFDAAFESHNNLDTSLRVVELREGPYTDII